jgi:hypothetical protein
MPTTPRPTSLAPSGLDRGAPDTGPRRAGGRAGNTRRTAGSSLSSPFALRSSPSLRVRGARRHPPAVEADANGRPLRLRLGRAWLPVRHVQETWIVEGRWWATEERRQYARVEAGPAVVELVRRHGEPWAVSRVLD